VLCRSKEESRLGLNKRCVVVAAAVYSNKPLLREQIIAREDDCSCGSSRSFLGGATSSRCCGCCILVSLEGLGFLFFASVLSISKVHVVHVSIQLPKHFSSNSTNTKTAQRAWIYRKNAAALVPLCSNQLLLGWGQSPGGCCPFLNQRLVVNCSSSIVL